MDVPWPESPCGRLAAENPEASRAMDCQQRATLQGWEVWYATNGLSSGAEKPSGASGRLELGHVWGARNDLPWPGKIPHLAPVRAQGFRTRKVQPVYVLSWIQLCCTGKFRAIPRVSMGLLCFYDDKGRAQFHSVEFLMGTLPLTHQDEILFGKIIIDINVQTQKSCFQLYNIFRVILAKLKRCLLCLSCFAPSCLRLILTHYPTSPSHADVRALQISYLNKTGAFVSGQAKISGCKQWFLKRYYLTHYSIWW